MTIYKVGQTLKRKESNKDSGPKTIKIYKIIQNSSGINHVISVDPKGKAYTDEEEWLEHVFDVTIDSIQITI